MPEKLNVFWFRRDLRLEDNVGLYHAFTKLYKELKHFYKTKPKAL